MLLYHFGSKEKMVDRDRQRKSATSSSRPTSRRRSDFAEACLIIWKRMTAPDSEPVFRLFFEIYGIALTPPAGLRSFLHDTVEDWLSLIADPLCGEGCDRRESRAFATLVLAGMRGFMLDFCTTHDRKRLDRAVEIWLGSLNAGLPARRKVHKP